MERLRKNQDALPEIGRSLSTTRTFETKLSSLGCNANAAATRNAFLSEHWCLEWVGQDYEITIAKRTRVQFWSHVLFCFVYLQQRFVTSRHDIDTAPRKLQHSQHWSATHCSCLSHWDPMCCQRSFSGSLFCTSCFHASFCVKSLSVYWPDPEPQSASKERAREKLLEAMTFPFLWNALKTVKW